MSFEAVSPAVMSGIGSSDRRNPPMLPNPREGPSFPRPPSFVPMLIETNRPAHEASSQRREFTNRVQANGKSWREATKQMRART